MLLRASGTLKEAREALTRVSNEPGPRTPDDMLFLAAFSIKEKLRCSDHNALKKLLGPTKYRTLWNKLKAGGQKRTLEQIARRYAADVKLPR
jgi:hypothetical protein